LGEGIYFVARKQDRHGSFFLNPNFYGAFIVLMFYAVMNCFFIIKENCYRIIILAALLLSMFALLMTQSRGPILSFGFASIIYLLIPSRRFGFIKRTAILSFVIFLLYLAMPGFLERAGNRFGEEELFSENMNGGPSRAQIWEGTIELIKRYPLIGIGLGEKKFKHMMEEEIQFSLMQGWILDNPHNSYLQIAVMVGIGGLAMFIVIYFIIIKNAVKYLIFTKNEAIGGILCGLVSGLMGFLIALFFDMGMFTVVAIAFWIIMGLTYSLTKKAAAI
jgi:O-antigen ligase